MKGKKMKKLLALGLSLVMVLTLLAGCGSSGEKSAEDLSPQDAITQAMENLDNVKSMSYDMDMDMDFGMTMGDEELESLKIKTTAEADYILDPVTMKMTMNMDMGDGESLDMLSYLQKDGDKYVMYTGTENEDGTIDWSRTEMTDLPDIEQYKAADSMKLYMSNGENFTENGTEQVNGMDAVRYDGIIKGEDLQEVMDTSGMSEQMAALNIGSPETLFSDAGDMPISIWIDKEQLLPVKYEMDMSVIMQSIMEKALTAQLEGLEGADSIKIAVNKVLIAMDVKNYNQIDSIEIPEEALNAPLVDPGTAAEMDPTAQ